VHEVVAADALDAKVAELTSALVSASPNAVRACKRLVQDVAEREIDDALVAHTVVGIADIRSSAEGKEGVQSFLQKRKPNWLLWRDLRRLTLRTFMPRLEFRKTHRHV